MYIYVCIISVSVQVRSLVLGKRRVTYTYTNYIIVMSFPTYELHDYILHLKQ